MKKKLLFILVMAFCQPAFAERTLQSEPVSPYDINESFYNVLNQVSMEYLRIDEIFYAIGTQDYRLIDNNWVPAGPLASLHPAEERNAEFQKQLTKIGFHNQNIRTPSWEFERNGFSVELIAKNATPVKGATLDDIAWLFVELEPNDHGIVAIIRSHTRAGLPPNNTNFLDGVVVGVGYQTMYGIVSDGSRINREKSSADSARRR